jgi:3-dehydrotetronate 4-kinase
MIGAIADDFTGGTDVAVAFRRAGLRTVIVFGGAPEHADLPSHDALVVALKTRTVPVVDAVRDSVAAGQWLLQQGAHQLYFKYCSTFDSRPEGNIGQVADALAQLTGARTVAVMPASPEHGRTQYQGHLFVHEQLLSDSPMRHHPLTPMTNARIAEVLAAQTPHPVRSVHHTTVRAGTAAVRTALGAPTAAGVQYAVIDAVSDDDLTVVGAAVADAPLITGAAGLAGGVGRALVARGGALHHHAAQEDPVGAGRTAVLAGSCSARTLEQIGRYQQQHPSWFIDALHTPDAQTLADQALQFVDAQPADAAPLLYSSVPPAQLQQVQQQLGPAQASEILETATGLIARGLLERGVRRIVIAGGETSGAVVTALQVKGGIIGEEQAPGVPWIYTQDDVALLLKSGNFGGPDMLVDAAAAGQAAHVR